MRSMFSLFTDINADSVSTYTAIIILVVTLIFTYIIYKILFKAKFYSVVALAFVIAMDRAIRTTGKLTTSSFDAPKLVEGGNRWLWELVNSPWTYLLNSALIMCCVIWAIIDVGKRMRKVEVVKTNGNGKHEIVEANILIPDGVIKPDSIVTILEKESDDFVEGRSIRIDGFRITRLSKNQKKMEHETGKIAAVGERDVDEELKVDQKAGD